MVEVINKQIVEKVEKEGDSEIIRKSLEKIRRKDASSKHKHN